MLDTISKAIDNPKLIKFGLGRHLNRAYHTRFNTHEYNPRGIDVFEEDWDNLIILDACRYSHFSEYDLPGHLESRYSRGSATNEFVTANFKNKRLYDLVYVSANAWFPRLKDEINAEVHEFVNLQRTEYQNEQLGVELPETVTEQALRTAERYPNKRLLVHYIQPHYPYIGPTGRKHIPPKTNMTKAILDAGASPELIRTAYRENLDRVMDQMEELLDNLEGKTVVTADHGELLGERSFPVPYREYGHPWGTYTEKLVKVPWNVYDPGPRKEIVSEEPTDESDDVDEELIDERLRNLGYRVE